MAEKYVVVNYPGNKPQAQEIVAGIEKAGGQAVAVRADVSKVSDVVRLFDAVLGILFVWMEVEFEHDADDVAQ